MLFVILGAVLILSGCARSGQRRLPRDITNAAPTRGWAATEDDEPNASLQGERASEVLSYAAEQIGKPYCWGGEGPRCFDCSGLAQMAWSRAGVRIPRTTHDMAKSLREIPIDDVQAGDLLWWPGHVAIYEGRGWMIDALNAREGVVRRRAFSEPRDSPVRAFRPDWG